MKKILNCAILTSLLSIIFIGSGIASAQTSITINKVFDAVENAQSVSHDSKYKIDYKMTEAGETTNSSINLSNKGKASIKDDLVSSSGALNVSLDASIPDMFGNIEKMKASFGIDTMVIDGRDLFFRLKKLTITPKDLVPELNSFIKPVRNKWFKLTSSEGVTTDSSITFEIEESDLEGFSLRRELQTQKFGSVTAQRYSLVIDPVKALGTTATPAERQAAIDMVRNSKFDLWIDEATSLPIRIDIDAKVRYVESGEELNMSITGNTAFKDYNKSFKITAPKSYRGFDELLNSFFGI